MSGQVLMKFEVGMTPEDADRLMKLAIATKSDHWFMGVVYEHLVCGLADVLRKEPEPRKDFVGKGLLGGMGAGGES